MIVIESTPIKTLQHQPGTILVVDDNPTNLGVAVNCLEDQGFTVLIARDGHSGIKRAKYAHPDLILLDVLMPGIDGFETCRQLKATPETQEIPIIFMTALSNTEDKVKGFELGAVDYVTKPIQIEEVIARVSLHLKLHFLNQALEQRVEERTTELNTALKKLQQSQLQLVQHEKMSALGQLMSGITHEINNPVSFIAGNLSHVQEYLQDLKNHLQLYQQVFPDPGEEIQQNAEEIELDYLLEDLPEILSSMKTGVERIREISHSMRIFSRSDQDQKIEFNIHESIDSTLLILKHRLQQKERRPKITVVKNYSNILKITGFPGQLNQVFMNIIANSIDAFDEMSESLTLQEMKKRFCQIQIDTEMTPDQQQVMIIIRDNGCGMTEDVKRKIFEHLFTTKTVGKGTGLGLSITRQIIDERHHGRIECESKLGQGTQFKILIPVS